MEDSFEEVKSHRRSSGKGRLRAVLISVLVVVLAAGGVTGLFYLVTRGGGGMSAPDVVGESFSDARDTLEAQGLSIEVDEGQDTSSRDLSKLKVVEQFPKPDSDVDEGDVVTVRLKGLVEVALEEETEEGVESSAGSEGDARENPPASLPAATAPQPAQQPATSNAAGRVVCIDPGHSSGSPSSEIDPATGLDVADNGGASGEIEAMWQLAVKVKADLEAMGYSVRLTKPGADSYASLKSRAETGNACSLTVRLHFDPDLHALLFPGEGQYKEHGGRRVVVDPAVAAASRSLAETLYPHLQSVGVTRLMNDAGGTSNNTGPAYVGSVLSRVPVVLIENDPGMVRGNPSGRDRVAAAIAAGIDQYLKTH